MKRARTTRTLMGMVLLVELLVTAPAWAQYWTSFADNTRYMALGDSLSAGYGAHPATEGFVYQLYQSRAIDKVNNLLLCNVGVPNAMSADVLAYQVPMVPLFFAETGATYRKVITLTVGGNDLFQIFGGLPAEVAIGTLAINLGTILGSLTGAFPDAHIYVANQYDPRLGVPGEADLIAGANQVIAGVVHLFPNATLVDIFSAFDGRHGLLLAERRGAEFGQIHPTNAGYGVMAKTFADAIKAH
jgi:lysophospholipase L1-like esterase